MATPDEILKLLVKYERVNNRLRAYTAKPVDYGTGEAIYYPELQIIKAVYKNPDMNITKLAEMFSLTKGAISQTANKLVDRGYLRKYKYEDNKKEVFMALTDKGEIVAKNAYASYEGMVQILIDFFEEDPSRYQAIWEFLEASEKLFDSFDE